MKENHEFRIVITPFCNYRCFFCHSEGLTKESTPLSLSPKDYEFIARMGKELWGWDTITITGGEPILSPIYLETCELIKKAGIKITTVTNASLISSPKKILMHNSQINVSIHTTDPKKYRDITGTDYPLSSIIDTIIGIRVNFPKMTIHLNSTVIRGVNDTPLEMEKIIKLASMIGAEAKFIDLASDDKSLVVSYDQIEENLKSLGFKKVDFNNWQSFFVRNDERAIITRCGFSIQNSENGYRSIFLNPDGTITTDSDKKAPINLLREIHSQDKETFAKKIEWYFPPAKKL